jgi:hypothetical protein
MLLHVDLVKAVVSEEHIASIIRVTKICEIGTTLAVTSNLNTLKLQAIRSSETPVLTRPTWRNIPEDGILHSHRRENLKSYNSLHNLPYITVYTPNKIGLKKLS